MTDGFGGSDHQSFYAKDVPVLFAFTGVHSDYHRPSDDSDRINYGGMGRIADYLELITLDLIRRPERPRSSRWSSSLGGLRRGARPRRRARIPPEAASSVTMGTMPDYEYERRRAQDHRRARRRAGRRRPGSRAATSIVRFGGKPVGTIYDYMESMHGYKPGDQVEVVVKRDGKEVKLKVTLEGRPGN